MEKTIVSGVIFVRKSPELEHDFDIHLLRINLIHTLN